VKRNTASDCANCTIPVKERICLIREGKGSRGCPTAGKKKLILAAKKYYQNPDIREFARQASIQEGECYAGRDRKPYIMHPTKPRIQEICEFARKMHYARLGLVFCAGLIKEAAIVGTILKNNGFEVMSVICKAGAVPKEEIGVQDSEKIYIGRHESMCNPILQALTVNEAKTDFNVLLGLCVGHDSLFFKYAQAPTTVLAVKDRVTGHNPLAAVYLAGNYYGWLGKEK
jgi:uncharacterized metal-binding protein